MTLSESIGNYSQTLRIDGSGGDNYAEVKRDGEVLYSGIARRIVDVSNKLTFVDVEDKEHVYIKYATYSIV